MWDWLFQFIDPLETADIPYAVVGSVASSLYGEPRATNDVDLVIHIGASDAARLIAAYPEKQFYVPPQEVIEVELGRSHGAHINVIALESMTKADLYPLGSLEREWFGRRRRLEVTGKGVWFAAPESVILHKLRFYREGGGERHLRDIRGMLLVSGLSIDRAEIERTCAQLKLADEWAEVQRG